MTKKMNAAPAFRGPARLFIVVRLALALFLCSTVAARVSAQTQFSGGDGTSENPFLISTAEQLAQLARAVNTLQRHGPTGSRYTNKAYKLIADIDLSEYGAGWNNGSGWIPIGNGLFEHFGGSFDGNNKKITGLYINTNRNYTGLFGVITSDDGVVKNLGIEGGEIRGVGNVGSIAGYIRSGNVINCHSTAVVSGTRNNIGGLVGHLGSSTGGTISNSHFTGTVSGSDNIGGVVGHLRAGGRIINCRYSGTISGNQRIGGVAGLIDLGGIVTGSRLTDTTGDDPHLTDTSEQSLAIGTISASADTQRIVGLTILVDFPDRKSNITREMAYEWLNREGGVGGNSPGGSVYDYFHEVSNGLLQYRNIVTPFVTVDKDFSYYDRKLKGEAMRPFRREFVSDVLSKLSATGFDMSEVTTEMNLGWRQEAVALNILYAGSTAHGWTEGLWPYAGDFSFSETVSGVNFRRHQVTNLGDADTMPRIGVFVHENGHMLLNWPDLYSYMDDGSGVNPVGRWCVMGNRGDDNVPQPPNAYFRHLAGWITVTDITDALVGTEFSLKANGHEAYLYRSRNNREFYFIEARMNTDPRNSSLPGSGLMIWHVHRDGLNTRPDSVGFPHVALIQADGMNDLQSGSNRGDATDLFRPRVNTTFNSRTNPAAVWHNRTPSGLNITEISDTGAVITFKIGTGEEVDRYAFTGGGTNANPYLIGTAGQMARMAEIVNSGSAAARKASYRLTADIDISEYGEGQTEWNDGKGWVPIGNVWTTRFMGTFDGNNNKISGLYINDTTLDNAGLFGIIDSGGTVRNLGVEGGKVRGKENVGGVAGQISAGGGSIVNSHSTGTVSGDVDVGGVAGYLRIGSAITKSHSSATIRGGNRIGGVAGRIDNASVTDSYFTGIISGVERIGGVVGLVNNGGSVVGSRSTGTVSSDSNMVGGVAGQVSGSVSNSHSTGTISGNQRVGGVAGSISANGSVTDSHSSGAVSGDNNVGGVAGQLSGNVSNSHSIGAISGNFRIGGVVGSTSGSGSITDSHSTGAISSDSNMVGGVVGQIGGSGSVTNSHSTGIISGNQRVGGVAGSVSAEGSVVNSYSSGAVSGDNNIGGVAGQLSGNVSNSHSIGAISGNLRIGGVVGSTSGGGSITDSHSTGAISSDSNMVGGVVGQIGGSGSVTNSHSTGIISGNLRVGGVAGAVSAEGSVIGSHSSGAVSGDNMVGGVAGQVSGSVSDSHSTGAISGDQRVGGVAGAVVDGGSIANNAALNPSVTRITGNSRLIGRVVGQNNGTLSGNTAYVGMTGGPFPDGDGGDHNNGVSVGR
ncbi:MAG: M6 family metalloprotease domain-containing protein [Chitinispirillales bacterium]|jgi:M6 family metalloprotease-like protein|nr:M6 family metalloprotease domain-containing protein [Chitinispirillales bacterium]